MVPLSDLPVLVLDLQATSSSPAKGHLLELAWSETTAAAPSTTVVARRAKLPEGTSIPPAVTRVTGMTFDSDAGDPPLDVYAELLATSRGIARRCPTIAHFAAFERSYLRYHHDRLRLERGEGDFPFLFLCTRDIARRLVPELPRHGLRAVAGYFGHGVPELRRSSDHVRATASVWSHLVALLQDERSVTDLDALLDWLRSPPPRSAARRSFPMPARLLTGLPRTPGVYRLLRENGDVLYVGKATVLRERVRSYFRPNAPHRDFVLEMLSQARGLELVSTGSALEAALLEVDEIKRLSPPYNRALRSRDRKLVFATRDLSGFSDAPDSSHPVGPLPKAGSLWRAFSLLAARLRGEAVSRSEDLFADEGLVLFRQRLGTTSLLAHGAREWLRQPEPPETEATEFRLTAPGTTPETACEALNDIVRRASHLVRRASWLATLSESTIVWSGQGGEPAALVLEGGAVSERVEIPKDPPGWKRPFSERRRRMDLATYDRLSVLTTEIKRLAAEGRFIELHLGPRRCLDREKLSRLLRWV